jgi:CHAT domain-containing protein
MRHRLLRFIFIFLTSCLVIFCIANNLFQNQSFSLQAGWSSHAMGAGSPEELNICTGFDCYQKYRQSKERYTRTRDLQDFKQGMIYAGEALEHFKQNSEVTTQLNNLGLLLEVTQWQQQSKKNLDQEKNWVPSQIVDHERAVIDYHEKDWQQKLNEILQELPDIDKKLQNLSSESKSVYTYLSYASKRSRLQDLAPSKFLELNSNVFLSTIDSILEKALFTELKKTPDENEAYAYALGSVGKYFEKSQDIENSPLKIKLKEYCSKSEKCTLQKKALSDSLSLNLEFAQIATEKALMVTENLRSFKTLDSLKIDYQTYQWLWQLGRVHELKSENQSAIAAYRAAIHTLERMRKALLSISVEEQFTFRDEVEPVYREFVSLLLNDKSNGGYLEEVRELVDRLQLAELENFLGCNLPIKKEADYLANENPSQDSSAVVIYPVILRDRIEAIFSLPNPQKKPCTDIYSEATDGKNNRCLTHTSIQVSDSEVHLKLRELRYYLEKPYISARARKLSKEVYSWLIEQAETKKWLEQNQTLLFIPDGALRNIPMAALEDKKGDYLIEKYAVAIAPRLQLLADNGRSSKHPKALLAALTEKSEDKKRNKNFGKLEYAQAEVDAIQGSIKDFKALTGNDFTLAKLENAIQQGVNIVHLATHGEFNFSREDTFILTHDSSASLDELEKLFQKSKNSIDLLVLSACETATGDDRDTLGIAGMTVRTRARSAISTLWGIDDPSAPEFMEIFYNSLIKQKSTKAKALRDAQLYFIKQSPSRNAYKPSHWASYVLVGDWRAL